MGKAPASDKGKRTRGVANPTLHPKGNSFTLALMCFRSLCGGVLLLICAALCGCFPPAEGQMDEQKNPYFIAGRDRVEARDYKGAIEAFEKAIEDNPRSVQAHFELGVLCEQHENDVVEALYHYNRVLKLRPNVYPADNARQRIAACKQELVKSESLAPVYQSYQTMQRDLEKLKEENQLLRKQLENSQASAGSRPLTGRSPNSNQAEISPTSRLAPASPRTEIPGSENGVIVASREQTNSYSGTTVMSSKTHTIKAGDTLTSIARQYRVKLEALTAINPGLDARKLKVGRTVSIPST
jgi:tetratricopeptide (TPR) repeat protein